MYNLEKKYEDQEMGHTVGAKFVFDAFFYNCATFSQFIEKILKSNKQFLTVYNNRNSDVYLSLNIFGNKSSEEIIEPKEID